MDTSFTSNDSTAGVLQLIFGPMFSGKSTELMRRIRRYKIAQKACLVIKYRADTRYSVEKAVTHDKIECDAVPCSKLEEVEEQAAESEVIGIDEGQFFPDIFEFCNKWANEGKIIVVAALDGTFQRKPFGNVLTLVPIAEKVTKLSAVCMACCQRDAGFTYRMSTETEVEVIGGADKYVSLCRGCYNEQSSEEFKLKDRLTPKKRGFVPSEVSSPVESPTKISRVAAPIF